MKKLLPELSILFIVFSSLLLFIIHMAHGDYIKLLSPIYLMLVVMFLKGRDEFLKKEDK